ncbi:MAG: beta-galactosidase [Lachnospiraceae bacterium]|nr:beta-galactosidase [Lachnospiraceae bacterium]
MGRFEIKDNFYLDGKPFRVISGSIHYFRVVPEYWRDRLEKLKAMGCNTVETYIAWNVHEPKKGVFEFEGRYDLVKFVRTAQELGLYVILRPSPYICAEWEFGGLPAWLLAEDGMRLRACHESFLKHVREYYDRLFPLITPLQITEGGPVILMQVENEYGYYGDDTRYMETMRDLMLERGVTVPLITSDGPFEESLSCGCLDGIHPTGNFGSRTKERFAVLAPYAKGGPLMCAEFWVGWFDHWGNGGHMYGNPESPQDLDDMLDMGHVNIYMFEGGTNFGFMNGSNYYDELTPDVTSYDYDALLTEAGDFTGKYHKFQKVISKYAPIPKVEFTTEIKKRAYGKLTAVSQTGLLQNLENLSEPIVDNFPVCMEKCGQSYGYILYHSTLKHEQNIERIRLWGANDRANIFVDGRRVVNLYDRELDGEYDVLAGAVKKAQDVNAAPADEEAKPQNEPVTFAKDAPIDILMENMGRVNFGPLMERQRKGIAECVQINGHIHYNWTMYPLPLDNIDRLDFDRDCTEGLPAFYRFELEVDEACDTFLELDGWGKGCVFLNGFNLGRYWEIGPQKRLYIPAPLLKSGKNEIVVFETEGKATGVIELKDEPDIG